MAEAALAAKATESQDEDQESRSPSPPPPPPPLGKEMDGEHEAGVLDNSFDRMSDSDQEEEQPGTPPAAPLNGTGKVEPMVIPLNISRVHAERHCSNHEPMVFFLQPAPP